MTGAPGALALRDRLATGALRAVELAEACLAQVRAREGEVRAFAWLDEAHVRAEAARLDAHRASGRPVGPLHGLPVAVKDVIDTGGIPTANGTPLDAGRVPVRDAAVVARLKAAGAYVFGKAATTELAFMAPGPTRNPANPGHTPGGSSQGSAAAVAAGMVPLGIGTQTGGSVIRPAAFCGVTGFKPSFGAIPRTGILPQAPSLDTVGVFARAPEDAALLAEALFGDDPGDAATAPAPHPRLLATAMTEPPVRPRLLFLKPPGWETADGEMRAALEDLALTLGNACLPCDFPEALSEGNALRARVNFAEMAWHYRAYAAEAERLSPVLRGAIATGAATTAPDYLAALAARGPMQAVAAELFGLADALLVPAAPGPAPAGLDSTGDPVFNGLWTWLGLPALTLPLFQASNGLPMGAQLVGAAGQDGRLLRTARWLVRAVGA